MKSTGTPIPTNDLWIAASVLETGGVLITADKHHLSIPFIRTKSFYLPPIDTPLNESFGDAPLLSIIRLRLFLI